MPGTLKTSATNHAYDAFDAYKISTRPPMNANHACEMHADEMHADEIHAYKMTIYGRTTPVRDTLGSCTPMGDAHLWEIYESSLRVGHGWRESFYRHPGWLKSF
jgi:hypothetical protein